MPTENRSSTIEQHDHIEGVIDMVSAPFQREDRYIVVKRSDLALLSPVDSDLVHSYLEGVLSLMAEWNCPEREYLVLESDWPEFAPAWAAIERRVTGSPAPQPHPEPIAWMVGTAIWWTNKEAERDAVATGLPIVGVGPMTSIAPADHHQGEPVAIVTMGANDKTVIEFLSHDLKVGTELYTHADPGEAERLRLEVDRLSFSRDMESDRSEMLNVALAENETLRTQQAETIKLITWLCNDIDSGITSTWHAKLKSHLDGLRTSSK
ncbi:hypothetical protein ABOC32_16590 [Pseudomonas sp. WOUb67]|uniref:hypothetical protein n=1 Tax=Pseudomonas sp. WOUb67 TaxID=3161136 RepID=UPI003CF4BF5B